MRKLKKLMKNDLNAISSTSELAKIKENIVFNKKKSPLIFMGSVTFLTILLGSIIILFLGLRTKVSFLGMEIVRNNSLKSVKDSSIIVEEAKEYYAKPGEVITLELNFNNENYYDIVSFVVSGTPYTSYMFNDGSNYKTIYVDYQVPSVSGTFFISVSEIKYIDGTKIKNVKMEGNDTVEIGIMYANCDIEIENFRSDVTSIAFDIKQNLPKELLDDIELFIYEKDTLIDKFTIKESYVVTNLKPGTIYKLEISGIVDLLDGKGKYKHYFLEKEVSTKLPFSLSEIEIGNNYADFSKLPATVYYEGKEVIRLDNLDENEVYEVLITYSYNNTLYEYYYYFSPSNKELPTISFDALVKLDSGGYLLTFTADKKYDYYVKENKCNLINDTYVITIQDIIDLKVSVYLDNEFIGDVQYEKNRNNFI